MTMTKYRPTEPYLHEVRQALASAFPAAGIFVGGGWSPMGEPRVLYEIDWGDGSKVGGRFPVDIGKEWDIDDARERVAVIVAALLGDDEDVS